MQCLALPTHSSLSLSLFSGNEFRKTLNTKTDWPSVITWLRRGFKWLTKLSAAQTIQRRMIIWIMNYKGYTRQQPWPTLSYHLGTCSASFESTELLSYGNLVSNISIVLELQSCQERTQPRRRKESSSSSYLVLLEVKINFSGGKYNCVCQHIDSLNNENLKLDSVHK
jgi:hypothetical protein